MAHDNRTCGGCRHGIPCREIHQGKRYETMDGWLACAIRQTMPEDKARFLSPNRAACSEHDPKTIDP